MITLSIIPSRFGSTRFPGKPLALIGGITMVERVYRQAMLSDLDHVVVATDDTRIEREVTGFGGQAVMTDAGLPTGTDRCRQALERLGLKADVVVNIQGDEPFINPAQINTILALLSQPKVEIATLASPASGWDEAMNPNRVKVVMDQEGKALYFSRLPIPYSKNAGNYPYPSGSLHSIHLGIYGFKSQVLMNLGLLKKSALEESENLEQLRWLEGGYSIHCSMSHERSDAVDTPEDLAAIEKKYLFDQG